MINVTTVNFYDNLFQIALSEKGYDTHVEDGYIYANSKDENLLILPVRRKLSIKESKSIKTRDISIQKLKAKSATLGGDYIPCLAFGVGKYTYLDNSICIVKVSIFEENVGLGNDFSISSGFYRYNYNNLIVTSDVILRANLNLSFL